MCSTGGESEFLLYRGEDRSQSSARKIKHCYYISLSGQATARQIEEEFKHVVEGSNWRWTAKAIAANRFSLSF
jgi:hypothetical protein